MFTTTGCFRHATPMLSSYPRSRHDLFGKALRTTPAVCSSPAVDIGGTPSSADADSPPLLRLHERCTTVKEPFSWHSVSGEGPSSAEVRRKASEVIAEDARPLGRISKPWQSGNVERRSSSNGDARAPLKASFGPLHQCEASTAPISSPQLRSDLVSGNGVTAAEMQSAEPSQAVTTESDEHCSETHPGSICCTTTAVEKDATSNSCVVTLRTTVKLTDSRLHVAPVELEELAWLAAKEAAAEAVSALNRQCSRLLAGREERHRFVCGMLANGTIRDAKRMENGFGHVSYLVTLEDKDSGRRIRAAFKPRVEGDCEGWHRVPIEVAAYQLNLLLGMDVVPPAVMRQDCDVDWTHYPAGGAFIYWCGNARQLNSVPMTEWSVKAPVLLSDTRILDVLIQNSDRHHGHFLYAEHWADGEYAPQPSPQRHHPSSSSQQHHQRSSSPPPPPAAAWRGRMSPVLIDHAAGFRQDAFVCLDHENAFLTGATRHISARTYLRLRFLDAPSLRSALAGIVADDEIAALLSRRDSILAFFDGLVAEQGYDNVVLEA